MFVFHKHIFRFFYASSACIYPEFKQLDTNVSLKESDAWPAEVCLEILCFPKFLIVLVIQLQLKFDMFNYITWFSHKMHMDWRSLLQRNYASITTKILELNAALGGSITFMVLLGLGKVSF